MSVVVVVGAFLSRDPTIARVDRVGRGRNRASRKNRKRKKKKRKKKKKKTRSPPSLACLRASTRVTVYQTTVNVNLYNIQ